tara:strand:+ start:1250 stop:2404 length:1155 start_codon:yes stop_codon:yes gene_type:complete
MKIPFHRPNLPDNLERIFPESLLSGWLTTGSQVLRFEQELKKYIGSKYIIAVNSCTAALHLALAAREFGNGDKFIVPTFTFVSTVECGEYVGIQPIFVDCDKDSFLIDLNQVEDIVKKDKSVKAIIPVHYAGQALELEFLWTLADKYGLFILEDAAHALETSCNNIKVGNTDHAAAFSFYANKNITTGGEGGALATNNYRLATKARNLSLHGITKDGWNRFKKNGNWEYDIIELGYKYNLTDYAASFGLWQLSYIIEWQSRRAEIVDHYNKALNCIEGIKLPDITDGHSKHLYVIQLLNDRWSISRNQFIEAMNKKGIGLAVHYKPIHKLSYYKRTYKLNYVNFPNANSLFDSVVTLPMYPKLKDKEIDYIANNIIELYEKHSK